MCFYIHDQHDKEQTAKKDITVYKVILNSDVSYWQNFKYKVNTLYRLRKKLELNEYDEIHKGFHSFSSLDKAYRRGTPSSKVVEFTIPKGAKYYYNHHNDEYVSSSIRSGNLTKHKF